MRKRKTEIREEKDMRGFMLTVVMIMQNFLSLMPDVKFVKSTKDSSPQERAGSRFLNIKTKTL